MRDRSRLRSSGLKQIPVSAATVTLLGACMVSACGARVTRPESAVEAWVDAVRAGDWGAAWDQLADDARGGRSREEFVAWCDQNSDRLRDQADAIATALPTSTADVRAAVPIDSARDARLVWRDGGWVFADDIPLLQGGDTPQETLSAVAALLQGPAMGDLLAALSESRRQTYLDEIAALSEALVAGASADLAVFGDYASVVLGELTIQLRREDGIWRLDSIQQASSYGYYYE